jgi:hypothetical protein
VNQVESTAIGEGFSGKLDIQVLLVSQFLSQQSGLRLIHLDQNVYIEGRSRDAD